MTLLARLERWRADGVIDARQHDALAALVTRQRVSVFVELNALLYVGVVAIVAGIGWTISGYSERLGDVAIVSCLALAVGASLWFCVSRALPYAHHRVEAPGLAFDYILYMGCLVFAIELAYLQARFQWFGDGWDHSLFAAAAVFFALAYRFDNRLVLSLALASLGAWFGVRLSRFGLPAADSLRRFALEYGVLVALVGGALHRALIKPHFLETYLHVAANVLFATLVTGVDVAGWTGWLYLAVLLTLAAVAVVQGVRFGRFVFVVYGVLYGYAGVSTRLLAGTDALTSVTLYFVVSGSMVIAALVYLARRFGREA